MATIKEVVLKHHKKEDGTYNIKYRLTHNRKITYINTNYFAGEKQLKKDFTVKDKFLLSVISTDISSFAVFGSGNFPLNSFALTIVPGACPQASAALLSRFNSSSVSRNINRWESFLSLSIFGLPITHRLLKERKTALHRRLNWSQA
jgi:hypothetical protein